MKIWFTDDAHSTYFDDDEYTAGVPVTYVSTNNEESKYLNINASGSVYSCAFKWALTMGRRRSLSAVSVEGRAQCARAVQLQGRALLVCGLHHALIYAFRSKSSLYRTQLREHPRRTKIAVIGVAAVEIWLVRRFCCSARTSWVLPHNITTRVRGMA